MVRRYGSGEHHAPKRKRQANRVRFLLSLRRSVPLFLHFVSYSFGTVLSTQMHNAQTPQVDTWQWWECICCSALSLCWCLKRADEVVGERDGWRFWRHRPRSTFIGRWLQQITSILFVCNIVVCRHCFCSFFFYISLTVHFRAHTYTHAVDPKVRQSWSQDKAI